MISRASVKHVKEPIFPMFISNHAIPFPLFVRVLLNYVLMDGVLLLINAELLNVQLVLNAITEFVSQFVIVRRDTIVKIRNVFQMILAQLLFASTDITVILVSVKINAW